MSVCGDHRVSPLRERRVHGLDLGDREHAQAGALAQHRNVELPAVDELLHEPVAAVTGAAAAQLALQRRHIEILCLDAYRQHCRGACFSHR